MTHPRAIEVGILVLALGLCALGMGLRPGRTRAADAGEAPAYRIEHKAGECLSMLAGKGPLWTLHFSKAEGKPYFHPVCTADGTELTWLRPPDHTWHRALWFSWKYLNKLNYWEEDAKGVSQGLTEMAGVKFDRSDDGDTTVHMGLTYHPPGKPTVLAEKRAVRITLPDKDGAYRMDWLLAFTAQDQDVLLDRTPTKSEGGPDWGGYAGLSYRAVKAMRDYRVLDSEGRKDMAAHGRGARWMDFSGVLDAKTGKAAGVAMFDHPANPRHPTPWYVIMNGNFGYFSPALLFEKPLTLPAGKTLTLRYRVLIHPGRGQADQLQKEYEAFTQAGKDTSAK